MDERDKRMNDMYIMIQGLAKGQEELTAGQKEIKMALSGSPLGAKGVNERLEDVETKVTSLKAYFWKSQGVLYLLVPILLYVIQKYLL
jgi:hypothetical protein